MTDEINEKLLMQLLDAVACMDDEEESVQQEHKERIEKWRKTAQDAMLAGLQKRRELAAILAGLRMLQGALHRGALPDGIDMILTDDSTIDGLSADDIDGLCERLNA